MLFISFCCVLLSLHKRIHSLSSMCSLEKCWIFISLFAFPDVLKLCRGRQGLPFTLAFHITFLRLSYTDSFCFFLNWRITVKTSQQCVCSRSFLRIAYSGQGWHLEWCQAVQEFFFLFLPLPFTFYNVHSLIRYYILI